MDRALLSSVSAKVMRLLGVSNDLRDRGDEWPLLKVVKGLSVVVATVVDEVSIEKSKDDDGFRIEGSLSDTFFDVRSSVLGEFKGL